MKKSKIIVPALGILVLSTAASITGTVAWFTAQSRFETEVSEFAIVKTNNDLKCTQTAGLGTSVTDNVVSTLANYELTDASFDHANEVIVAPDGSGTKVGKETALGSAAVLNDGTTNDIVRASYQVSTTTHTVLSVMTWNMDFEMDFGGVNGNYGLYFDASTSKIQRKDGGNYSDDFSDAEVTGHGFRIAFVGQTATYSTTRVWADQQVSAKCKYINGSATLNTLLSANELTYTSPALMDSSFTDGVPASEEATATSEARENYLGKFVFQANTPVHLQYKVVAWFEGTDETIVNTATAYDQIKALLHFEVKKLTD